MEWRGERGRVGGWKGRCGVEGRERKGRFGVEGRGERGREGLE